MGAWTVQIPASLVSLVENSKPAGYTWSTETGDIFSGNEMTLVERRAITSVLATGFAAAAISPAVPAGETVAAQIIAQLRYGGDVVLQNVQEVPVLLNAGRLQAMARWSLAVTPPSPILVMRGRILTLKIIAGFSGGGATNHQELFQGVTIAGTSRESNNEVQSPGTLTYETVHLSGVREL